jgi:hypothetical protein
MNNVALDDILNSVCLDERVEDGIFSFENNAHLDALQEYLTKSGLAEKDSIAIRNRISEGKYPERQAYNKDGILVTFPTPEYKQNAIARGTHFEQNPVKAQANIFQTQPPQQGQAAAPAQPAAGATPPAAPEPTKLQPADLLPQTTQPASDEKDLKADAGETPEVDQRTPQEKKVDANAVQQILAAAPASIDISNRYPRMESTTFTLKEAINNNFYEKEGKWYDSDGNYIGKKWFCESTSTILISK